MGCRELVELVTDYLDGALAGPDRVRFEAHVAGCEGCGEYVREIRLTVEASARLEPEPMSPELRQRLMDAFRRR